MAAASGRRRQLGTGRHEIRGWLQADSRILRMGPRRDEGGPEETKDKPYIEGPNGKLYKGFRTDPPSLAEQVKYLPKLEPQISDFNVSVRTRQKFGLNELNGNRSNILIHLANAAIRLGRKLHFDPIAMQFINDPEANRLANQPMRAPWSL